MSRVESKKHVPHPVGLSIDDFRLGMQAVFFDFVQALRSATLL